ncbi:DNA-3-methyladenine glycosylase 2 [Massilia sp. BJB1822]|uniref:DNA-3-methyladenine glycosylase 2 n=1 Tax=Massilia sp. BJB1822 TaxID=2744470 RepID=UPI0015934BE8|nr:DNA-3-methyladenine glycosylase 2 [Massilia sp. BJB1822]NVD98262.1 DNA-3-methyladenine glycosylase 2 [Massilia sp. BJB1822]
MRFTISLPANYRLQDVLAFHSRDAESVAEEVRPERIRKGMLLDGVAVALTLHLSSTAAECEADADCPQQPLPASLQQRIRDAALNMLGLRIDPQTFLDFARDDAMLGPLVLANPGLRIVQSATVFEALTWAIIGQQINLPFAIALRRTFILQAGRQHSSGLWCYPEAADAARLNTEDLTSRKFSRAKAETLLRFAALVASDELRLEEAADNSIDAISQALLAVKGIGPWTVNYGLLRGYGYADCSLHGDVAIRAALQRLLGEDSKPDMARTERILQQYQPHRTMAAAHLWASLNDRPNESA